MSYLLCMDESGHDHGAAPFEVRGGICVHATNVWALTQKIKGLEFFCFGDHLHHYRSEDKGEAPELKGKKLLKSKKFTLAGQNPNPLGDQERQELCRRLLAKGVRKESPTRDELTAVGKASLLFCDQLLRVLHDHDVVIFASRIPRGTDRPKQDSEALIRKDQFFLFERFDRFLRAERETGILILDESDKALDRKYVNSLERLFRNHETARRFTKTIVPNPFFVASDMSYLVQAADIVLYILNWGFRLTLRDAAPPRMELENLDAGRIKAMTDRRRVRTGERSFTSYSVFDVRDPWEYRERDKEKEGNAFGAVFRAPRGRASTDILREEQREE